ncbi:transposase [Streptomyces sp. NPDC015127]|uniref:transposase n=1 Tax=Streptomyces sp. NPDC015127 TaxID=3364939 RepID=UPI0037024B66
MSWRDLPERFGLWQTVRGRCARWVADGTFGRLGRSPEPGGGGLAGRGGLHRRAGPSAHRGQRGLRNEDSGAPVAG